MNYRHAFHAGNFADVFKHVLLTRMLVYLTRKDAALRYIDTHAGIGRYDLAGDESRRTGEWRDGVGRIDPQHMPADVRELMQPYLDIVGLNEGEVLSHYPGSPLIAQKLLRRQDRIICCELHPQDHALLDQAVGRDRRVKVIEIDGYKGLNAFVPPPERRGLVLIDPPFEERDEFDRVARTLQQAHAKWSGGTYVVWYPIKDRGAERFAERIVAAGIARVLCLELSVADPFAEGPLSGTGLLVINPPYVLEEEARVLLPWLMGKLSRDTGASWRVERLTDF